LQRSAAALQGWQQTTADGPARLHRLAEQLRPVCRQQRAGSSARTQCEALLDPRPST
jgi:hypothetical protein